MFFMINSMLIKRVETLSSFSELRLLQGTPYAMSAVNDKLNLWKGCNDVKPSFTECHLLLSQVNVY